MVDSSHDDISLHIGARKAMTSGKLCHSWGWGLRKLYEVRLKAGSGETCRMDNG